MTDKPSLSPGETSHRKQSRRHFLTGAGAVIFLSTLQACGLGKLCSALRPYASHATRTPFPTYTPSPTSRVLSPTATSSATVTLSPAATPAGAPSPTTTPTEAATAEPTATATPGEPPTPTPTPYPPGPPSKLGLFTTRADGQIDTLIRLGKPALIKTLNLDPNFARYIKEHSPTTIVVGRIVLGQLDLTADPIPLAHAAAGKLLEVALEPTRFLYFDAWEAYNEPVADTVDKMQRLAAFEVERTRLLAEQGVRSVVGNFAAGHPPLELWGYFVPALDALRSHGGYLGLHEYSAPIMQWGSGALQSTPGADEGDEGWLTLRYRKSYRHYLAPMGYGDIPLLITECGVDGTIASRPGPSDAKGWRDFEAFWVSNGLRTDTPGV
jgi:hypothetical protein